MEINFSRALEKNAIMQVLFFLHKIDVISLSDYLAWHDSILSCDL